MKADKEIDISCRDAWNYHAQLEPRGERGYIELVAVKSL